MKIGNKAANLLKLKEWGIQVPDFTIVGNDDLAAICKNEGHLETVCAKIRRELPKQSYAVRSAAIMEDTGTSSMAGQFMTRTDVAPDMLESAMKEVIDNGLGKLEGDPSGFSIIVQEFIQADISGVCFTRDPAGGREMIIEYIDGPCADVVGGAVIPETFKVYRNEAKRFPKGDMETFLRVEARFGYPQDIEWCTRCGELFILQSRPITTLSEVCLSEMKHIEECTAGIKDFLFEKNEISEMAPRPTPFTLSLLNRIYAPGGPIARAYARAGVNYRGLDMFVIIGNELFVDKESELKSLLPSYSLLNEGYSARMSSLSDLIPTTKNIMKMALLKPRKGLETIIREKITETRPEKGFLPCLTRFLEDYEYVFEVNLLGSKALKSLELFLSPENISVAEALGSGIGEALSHRRMLPPECPIELKGNTLEISDEEAYRSMLCNQNEKSSEIPEWFARLAKWKRTVISKSLLETEGAMWLRELGRMLMIRNLSDLRSSLLDIAGPQISTDIYFFGIDEVLAGYLERDRIVERQERYLSTMRFCMPRRIQGRYADEPLSANIGISQGKARGIITDVQGLGDHPDRKPILFTKSLPPSLTRYFPSIAGIISESGGLLSHLAIMAREARIPIVVKRDRQAIDAGIEVEMDGSAGTITIL